LAGKQANEKTKYRRKHNKKRERRTRVVGLVSSIELVKGKEI
jgi:hypothetical protein